MSIVRVTKEFSFEMAHALNDYDGLCSQIHGHSYRLFITVKGPPLDEPGSPKNGMVMDFSVLKDIVRQTIVDRYDHALMLHTTPHNRELTGVLSQNFNRIELVDYPPTCENMVIRFAAKIRGQLPAGVTLHRVKLHETATSFAEWCAEDN